MTVVVEIAGWVSVGCGLFALTEGYHAVRQRGVARHRNLWWLAGAMAVLGFTLIRVGLGLTG